MSVVKKIQARTDNAIFGRRGSAIKGMSKSKLIPGGRKKAAGFLRAIRKLGHAGQGGRRLG